MKNLPAHIVITAMVCMTIIGITKIIDSHIPHRVTVYSGGAAVRVYDPVDNCDTNYFGGGWHFRDMKTRAFINVSGTVIVERQNK